MIKKNKSHICIILITALLIVFCPFAGQAQDTEIQYIPEFETERQFLFAVNEIIPTEAEASKYVTRAEFASYIVKMLNRTDAVSSGTEVVFRDVRPDDWIAGYLYVLLADGIIAGDSDGYFRGDEEILYEEAAKIVINALGYGEQTKNIGEYPSGHLIMADRLKLFSGIDANAGEKLTLDQICRLLYNAVNAPYVEVSRIISGADVFGAEYSVGSGYTILTELYGIKKLNGVVTANSLTGISGDVKSGKGSIKAAGDIYYTDNKSYQKLIGLNTELYYSDKDGVKEIVFAQKIKNEEITIAAEDVISMKSGVLRYYNGSRENKISISGDTDIIYNNKLLEAYDETKFEPDMGSVTFIDNDRDSEYDVVKISDCKNLYVKSVNAAEGYIIGDYYDKVLCANTVYNDKLEYYSIENADGGEISVSQIKKNDIVTYMESEDGSALEITVSSKKKSGVLSQAEFNDNIVLTIGETELKLDPYFSEYIKQNGIVIKAGRNYDYYLDCFGNVAAINFDVSSFNWGYLIAGGESSGLDKYLELKILDAGGDIVYYNAEQSLIINGEKCANIDKIMSKMSIGGNIPSTALGYKLNASGKITELLLPLEYGESTEGYEKFLQPMTNGPFYARYKSATRVVVPNMVIPDSATVFDVPSDTSNATDSSYNTVVPALIPNDTIKEWLCYRAKDGSSFSEVVVVYDYNAATVIDPSAYEMVVEDVTRTIDEDGQEKIKITGMYLRDRVEFTAYTDDVVLKAAPYYIGKKTEYKVESGDVIRVAVNASNEITKVEMFYDYSDDDMCIIDTGYASGDRWILKQVYDKQDNYLIFAEQGSNGTYNNTELHYFPKFVCAYTYDTVTKMVKSASYDDIKGMKDYGADGTKVFIHNHYGEMQTIIVYK